MHRSVVLINSPCIKAKRSKPYSLQAHDLRPLNPETLNPGRIILLIGVGSIAIAGSKPTDLQLIGEGCGGCLGFRV